MQKFTGLPTGFPTQEFKGFSIQEFTGSPLQGFTGFPMQGFTEFPIQEFTEFPIQGLGIETRPGKGFMYKYVILHRIRLFNFNIEAERNNGGIFFHFG